MRLATIASLLAGIIFMGVEMFGQAPGLAFEVASVKPNTSGSGSSRTSSLPGGGIVAVNNSVRQLIVTAYKIKNRQLTGGPDWINTDRFDVEARAPENAPSDQVSTMLKALLADRFQLVVHTETKEQPIYALVLARPDGKLGPQLKSSTLDCSTPASGRGAAGGGAGAGAGAPPPSPPAGQIRCGMNSTTNNSGGVMTAGGRSMTDLADTLANFVADRMVVDRTGLTGKFDFELRWAPDGLRTSVGDAAPPANDAPPIFIALQEQLGLKLEAQRGPVEFLVIDSVQHPTPN